MPASRADVIRRLTSRGIAPLQSYLRSALPSSRSAWAFLTGETIATAQRPATRDEALSLPAFGRGVELIASAVAEGLQARGGAGAGDKSGADAGAAAEPLAEWERELLAGAEVEAVAEPVAVLVGHSGLGDRGAGDRVDVAAERRREVAAARQEADQLRGQLTAAENEKRALAGEYAAEMRRREERLNAGQEQVKQALKAAARQNDELRAKLAEAEEQAQRPDPFYQAKLQTARFYFTRLMPETSSLMRRIRAGSEVLMDTDAALA